MAHFFLSCSIHVYRVVSNVPLFFIITKFVLVCLLSFSILVIFISLIYVSLVNNINMSKLIIFSRISFLFHWFSPFFSVFNFICLFLLLFFTLFFFLLVSVFYFLVSWWRSLTFWFEIFPLIIVLVYHTSFDTLYFYFIQSLISLETSSSTYRFFFRRVLLISKYFEIFSYHYVRIHIILTLLKL